MQLSKRLLAVADLARGSRVLADIGTDHAYLPIYLALHGGLERAVALDVNPGPLRRARENIRAHHLEGRIETRLSDGAAALFPGEADTVVLSGMGGPLAVRILDEGENVFASACAIVLQPQSEIAWVRRQLHARGYCIAREKMVKEEGKYYWAMRAQHGKEAPWQEEEYRYGRQLIRKSDPCLRAYLQKEAASLERILSELEAKDTARARGRAGELRQDLALARNTLSRMREGNIRKPQTGSEHTNAFSGK